MATFIIRAECLVEFCVEAETLEEAMNLGCESLDAQPKEVMEVYQIIEGEEA